MRYLMLHNYRKIKQLVIPNLLQIFFVLSIGTLTVILTMLQFKASFQDIHFS